MADVLFGDVNPSGKLPFTMPVKLEDSPAHALGAYPGENFTVEYKEGILVGYRWFDTKQIAPLYPFGYGLSYCNFSYDTPRADRTKYSAGDTIQVFCSVRNTGHYPAKETVQLYMHDRQASVMRPEKELKGFEKVLLKPKEKKEVCVRIPVCDLAFFDDQKMQWVVEPGAFDLRVGSSSRDIRGSVTVTVE